MYHVSVTHHKAMNQLLPVHAMTAYNLSSYC